MQLWLFNYPENWYWTLELWRRWEIDKYGFIITHSVQLTQKITFFEPTFEPLHCLTRWVYQYTVVLLIKLWPSITLTMKTYVELWNCKNITVLKADWGSRVPSLLISWFNKCCFVKWILEFFISCFKSKFFLINAPAPSQRMYIYKILLANKYLQLSENRFKLNSVLLSIQTVAKNIFTWRLKVLKLCHTHTVDGCTNTNMPVKKLI